MNKLDEINEYILEKVSTNNMDENMAFNILTEINKNNKENNDIAIIGMSCKLPGISNVDEYWKILINDISTVGEFPKERKKDIKDYLSEDLKESDNPYFIAGYLDEVDKFDPKFFKLSPVEAEMMEPAQRLFLETAYEAFEDAGYGREKIFNTNTGVFAGRDNTNNSGYINIINNTDIISLIGSYTSILSSRLSYVFNLHGPCTVIDTACSSGLVSVHTACKSLLNKECSMALAGGIQVFFAPTSDNNMLGAVEAKGNQIRAFDKSATGTVWGEGVAMVVLKPLNKALEDGDAIHAVIKGSAINNDGLSSALTAPNLEAQTDVILKAWKNAKINPETISYIETHGTGTILGDPLEIKGLTEAFKKYTNKKQFCGIGSVKTHIGHTVAASGIASIIKVVLAMKNRKIPASLHFDEPNPYIQFLDSSVYLNDTLKEWVKGSTPFRAGVTSLGFSGTNCHMILEEPPKKQKENLLSNKHNADVFVISAKSEEGLREILNRYIKYLYEEDVELKDLFYTANTGRGNYEYRLAIISDNKEDLLRKLNTLYYRIFKDIKEEEIFYGKHRVVTENKKNKSIEEITERERRILDKEVEEIVNFSESKNKEDVIKICKYYVKGAKVNWNNFYKGEKRNRLHLPTYPYKKERIWPKYNENIAMAQKLNKKELKHPFLQKCLLESYDEDIYLLRLSSDEHFTVKEHKISGNYIVPGTAYVEIIREISLIYYKDNNIEIKDLLLQSPIVVNEHGFKDIQLIVKKESSKSIKIIFVSKLQDQWIVHGECNVCDDGKDLREKYNIQDLISNFQTRDQKIQSEKLDTIFSFGPRWNSIESFATNKNEDILLKIKLPLKFINDLEAYNLHPSLLDNAVNGMMKIMKKSPYLPLLYKNSKIYKNIPQEFYSYIRKTSNLEDNEILTFDITLLDLEGNVIADIKEYTIKKTSYRELKFEKLLKDNAMYHNLNWIDNEKNNKNNDGTGLGNGNVLIFKDDTRFSNELIEKLKNMSKNIIEVEFGDGFSNISNRKFIINNSYDDYFKLFSELKEKSITGIIFNSALSFENEVNSLENLESFKKKSFFSLYYITRALVNNNYFNDIEIVLMCDYVHEITKLEEILNPHNALIVGLGKVICQEHSNFKCKCIDIDKETEINTIVLEILNKPDNYLIAYRNNKRYIQEFNNISNSILRKDNVRIKRDGVYIITGGTGGIGIEVAKYLASKEKVKICLVNHSKFVDLEDWDDILIKNSNDKLCSKIKELRKIKEKGSVVELFRADVSNEEEIKNLVNTIKSLFGKVNGIFHCAGVAGDRSILRKKEEDFQKVLKPKVNGTWILSQITEKEELDFTILFSSITSITGGLGQGDYTAANMYLDLFSSYWKKNNKNNKISTISWPTWSDTGMAVDYGVNEIESILKPINNETAIDVLDGLLNKDISYVSVGEIDYRVLSLLKNNYVVKLSNEMLNLINKKNSNKTIENNIKFVDKKYQVILEGNDKNEYSDIERKLGNCWGYILGLDKIDINENFFEIGGNSILEVKLQVELEKENIFIQNNDIYSYKTIKTLAQFIENKNNDELLCTGYKKKKENVNNENQKIVGKVEPFNDLFYKNCFYNSLFPIVNYYNREITYIIANDIMTYNNINNGIKIKYNEIESMGELISSIGLNYHTEIKVNDIIDTIQKSINENNFVIMWIDCYYASKRADAYNKIHMPHTWLIYGYDDYNKSCNIIEHKHKDSLSYEETTVSYNDIINCYAGYLKNLQNEVNKESYYEFNILNIDNNKIKKENSSILYSRNYLNNIEAVRKSLNSFNEYVVYLKLVIIDEFKLKHNIEKILKELNDIINSKLVEKYKISKLFEEEIELNNLLDEIIKGFNYIRQVIAKYMFSSKYNKEAFVNLTNEIDKLKILELEYNKMEKIITEKRINKGDN